MLNPSIADALLDDATIRKCMAFTRGFGFEHLVVYNLFTYRTSSPAELFKRADRGLPIDLVAENPAYQFKLADPADAVIVAWGVQHSRPPVAKAAHSMWISLTQRGIKPFCLAVNQDGSPKHPLYISKSAKLVPWNYHHEEVPR